VHLLLAPVHRHRHPDRRLAVADAARHLGLAGLTLSWCGGLRPTMTVVVGR
jgi:hypothetical protein